MLNNTQIFQNNDQWMTECKNNLNKLGFGEKLVQKVSYCYNSLMFANSFIHTIFMSTLTLANTKNDSIVRIACQPGNDSRLSKDFYLSNDASLENDKDYCQTVMDNRNKSKQALGMRSGIKRIQETEDDKDEKTLTFSQEDYTQCKITDDEDVGCGGCDVRFYHSKPFLSDKIFAPVEGEDQSTHVIYYIPPTYIF